MIHYSIDLGKGMKQVKKIESNCLFEADDIIQCKKKILNEAENNKINLVQWINRSKVDQGHSAATSCWKDKDFGKQKIKNIFLGKNKKILDVELQPISEASNVPKKTAKVGNTLIRIFCDSQKALKALAFPYTSQENQFLRGVVYQKSKDLQRNGYPVTFQWISSYLWLKKNGKANLAAKSKANGGGRVNER